MSQTPIDQRNVLNTREALWASMRDLGSFTAKDLAHSTMYHVSTVQTYLRGLVAAGYLSIDSTAKPAIYTLAPGLYITSPPRVRMDGSQVTQGQGRKNLWRTAKIMGEFSVKDLAVFASTSKVPIKESEAADYVYHLVKAGYLAVIQPAKARGGRARYKFLMSRYTGPLAPQVQRIKQVYDPNTRTVVWGGSDGK